jgi:hypothetical protein
MAKNDALFEAICKGNRKAVQEIVQKEIDAGVNVVELLNGTMIPAMRHIGDRFSRNEIYVPEMLIAARAMQAGLNLVGPLLQKAGHKARAKVAIGTVKGDLHDIGKNLVCMMLKGAGYEVMDLGVDCGIEKFEKAAAAEVEPRGQDHRGRRARDGGIREGDRSSRLRVGRQRRRARRGILPRPDGGLIRPAGPGACGFPSRRTSGASRSRRPPGQISPTSSRGRGST